MATDLTTRRSEPPIISAAGLNKTYIQRLPFSRKAFAVQALRNVDFEIVRASLTVLAGESGCGKSSLAKCLAAAEKPDSGSIWFEGTELTRLDGCEMASLRPQIQMVVQDSAGALNPRFTAAEIIAEPQEIQRREDRRGLHSRACELMEEVGLPASAANRHPLEFSGGQRQRLAIARALALQPSLLILDESLSGLDLSTQAHILNLLLDLQQRHSLTLLLISHDLSLVGQIADFVAVMHQGSMVEQGPCREVFSNPCHAHTQELLAAVRIIESTYHAAQAGAGR